MSTRFKPLLAAAFAAGLVPAFIGEKAEAGTITAAGFTFDGVTQGTTAGLSSMSVSADVFSPGYGGTLVVSKTATDGYMGYKDGNGTPNGIVIKDDIGSSFTYSFSLDNLAGLQMAFDMTGSSGSPANFVVSYSLDGVSYTPVSTLVGSNWGYQAFRSLPVGQYVVALPSAFSDIAPGIAGNMGYVQITPVGTSAIDTFTPVGSGGVAFFDSVYITGSAAAVPEPATVGVIAMAGVGLLSRRRR